MSYLVVWFEISKHIGVCLAVFLLLVFSQNVREDGLYDTASFKFLCDPYLGILNFW